MSKSLIALSALLAAALAQAASSDIAAAKVLHDNTGTDAHVGTVSQVVDGYASAAADDFTVPDGQTWTLEEVDVTGIYYNGVGPADSEAVTIYKASHGKVGKVVASYVGLKGTDNDGAFSIPIPKTRLEPGIYYVSVVADMGSALAEDWAWENMLEVHGHRPEWEDPSGGGRCQSWAPEVKCFGPGTGDHFFVLRGRAE